MGRRARSARVVTTVAAAMLVLAGACSAEADAAAPTSSTPRSTAAPTTEVVDAPDETTTTASPTTEPAPAPTAPADEGDDRGAGDLPEGRDVVVTSITDGDTFRAGDERVRLTGIDTPEVSGPVECYGPEATDELARLIPPGSRVRLVLDVEPTDRYDRTLAYVYRIEDGVFVNLSMARDGFAEPLSIAPNVAHAADIDAAAAEARDAGRGLWGACPGGAPTGATTTAPAPPPGGGCDPAYPDVCIPPAPPDLDCGDIPDRRFTVLAPDPHGFDGNGDGVGCES